ncbi:MAG TPA: cytochrome c oxidase subunit 3 [Casimicrobiaceae bacterium]|nr:cytochrome c oxidase subunit 3 [Casimicrobiaceae bacterium]
MTAPVTPFADRPAVIDAAPLPSFAFGHKSLMWWGTLGMMAIEGMAFALAAVMYFYIWSRARAWPPDVLPPELRWGSLNLLILLVSTIPNEYTKRAAERFDLRGVRIGLVACILFGIAFIGVRALEFTTLNVYWDTNAYGSAVYLLLGLHTVHLVTDVADSVVLAVLMFTDRIEGSRFADASENAMYWYFVVAAWLPIYAILYLAPRWM